MIIGFDESGGGIGGHEGPPLGRHHGLGPGEDRRGIRVNDQGAQVGVVLRHERGEGFPVVVEAVGRRGAEGRHGNEGRGIDRIGADVMDSRNAPGQGELPPHLQQYGQAQSAPREDMEAIGGAPSSEPQHEAKEPKEESQKSQHGRHRRKHQHRSLHAREAQAVCQGRKHQKNGRKKGPHQGKARPPGRLKMISHCLALFL